MKLHIDCIFFFFPSFDRILWENGRWFSILLPLLIYLELFSLHYLQVEKFRTGQSVDITCIETEGDVEIPKLCRVPLCLELCDRKSAFPADAWESSELLS